MRLPNNLRRIDHFEIEAALKLAVVLGLNSYWESALVRHDSRYPPSVHNLPRYPVVLWYRQLPVGTKNKAVARVQKRQSSGGAGVQRIQNILKRRALVNRFAESIGRLEQQTI